MRYISLSLVFSIILMPLNSKTGYASELNNNTETIQQIPFELLPEVADADITSQKINALQNFINSFPQINPEAIKLSLNAYYHLLKANKLNNKNILSIVDFTKPSTEERLFVINISTNKIIAKSLCAHGKNSGENYATSFSNEANSYSSSLGIYLTAETYIGNKGFSLKLDGQEQGINNNARDRGVVIHGADYVSYDFINANGRLGRSQGCPALPLEQNEKIISLIKGGTCFFIYHETPQYSKKSILYHQYNEVALAEFIANSNN